MKKFFLFSLFLTVAFIGALFFYALPKAKQDTLDHITKLGHKNATIEKSSITLSGFFIDKIILDTDGFSYIENIAVKLFWPSYLFKKDVKLITINKIHLATIANDAKSILSYKNNFDLAKIADISAQKIEVKNIIWDTATSQSAIRIEAKATIEKAEEKSLIKASLHAAQHELSFNSEWSGSIDKERNITLEGSLDQLNINYKPFHLHRATGWISYHQAEDESTLSGQLDSGSGKMFNVPIHNINLTVGKKGDYYPILFRAQASGIKNVTFTSDIHYSKNKEQEAFKTTLNIGSFSHFMSHLKTLKLIKNNFTTDNNKQTNIALSYMPKKRFADGPLPFDLNIKQDEKTALDGTFLVYTDSLDVRGTTQGNKDFITTLKKLFTLKDKNITEDVLRIDGNLKSLVNHRN